MNKVTLVEVGLRDGLQNESTPISIENRLKIASMLQASGLKKIEIGSFVNPKWVPSMAQSEQLTKAALHKISSKEFFEDIEFSVLVPNEKGFEKALEVGVSEIALFASCSESFSLKNINSTISESFKKYNKIAKLAHEHKIKIRGYLSVCFGCPFEGDINQNIILENVQKFKDMGVYEVSIGDTIGVASVGDVEKLFNSLLDKNPASFFAGHFHNTRGQALVNILKSYQLGLRVFDTSIGGLGGCPYAPGATGNVATEDVVYMFDNMGIESGVQLDLLLNANHFISQLFQRKLPAAVGLSNGKLQPLGKVK